MGLIKGQPYLLYQGVVKVLVYRLIKAGGETSADCEVRRVLCMVSSTSIFFWNAPKEKGVRLYHVIVLEENGNDKEKDLVEEADDGRDEEDERFVPNDTGKPD